MGIAGQGTFGTVLDVYDTKHRERIVLKVVRSVKRYLDAAYVEIDILEQLRSADPTKGSLVVRLYGSFTCNIGSRKHVCIAFERLGRSLYEFVKKNKYRGFRACDLRPIARQIIHSVRFCHAQKLTHTDLKLENVLFVDDDYDTVDTSKYNNFRVPRDVRVRLIDFGGATFENEKHARIINTRQYRAPEVIFGLEWTYPSDIWSIGCILAELATGDLLFQTHADSEHLKLMEIILEEPIPTNMVDRGLKPYREIKAAAAAGEPAPTPRLPEAPIDEIFDWDTLKIRWPYSAPSEESERHVASQGSLPETVDDLLLADLIRRCLQYDPKRRITARGAFEHPYFADDLPCSKKIEYMKFIDHPPEPEQEPYVPASCRSTSRPETRKLASAPSNENKPKANFGALKLVA